MAKFLTDFAKQEAEVKDLYSKGPVRRGSIYCSPWCGAKCTHAAFKRATQAAGNLADYLGKGWKADVWENVGWFYEVTKGSISVRPSNQTAATQIGADYRVVITVKALHDGVNRFPQFMATHHDPRAAVKEALARFDAYIATVAEARKGVVA